VPFIDPPAEVLHFWHVFLAVSLAHDPAAYSVLLGPPAMLRTQLSLLVVEEEALRQLEGNEALPWLWNGGCATCT